MSADVTSPTKISRGTLFSMRSQINPKIGAPNNPPIQTVAINLAATSCGMPKLSVRNLTPQSAVNAVCGVCSTAMKQARNQKVLFFNK